MTKRATEVSTKLNINQDHVVQVIVSEIEERLITQRTLLAEDILSVNNELSLLNTTVEDTLLTLFTAEFEEKANVAAEAIKVFTGKNVTTRFKAWTERDIKTRNPSSITGTVSIVPVSSSRYTSSIISIRESIKLPDELKKRYITAEVLQVNLSQLSSELITVNRNLRDLPRYERRTKSCLAASVLAETSDGAKILADLRANVIDKDVFLKSLPRG